MENKIEFVKHEGLWLLSVTKCPTCEGEFKPMLSGVDGNLIFDHEDEGLTFYECPICKGRLIFRRKGKTTKYRFLPRNWAPMFKKNVPIFEIYEDERILSTSDCPLYQCEGSLESAEPWKEKPGAYLCGDCSGVLTFHSKEPKGFQFLSIGEYRKRKKR